MMWKNIADWAASFTGMLIGGFVGAFLAVYLSGPPKNNKNVPKVYYVSYIDEMRVRIRDEKFTTEQWMNREEFRTKFGKNPERAGSYSYLPGDEEKRMASPSID